MSTKDAQLAEVVLLEGIPLILHVSVFPKCLSLHASNEVLFNVFLRAYISLFTHFLYKSFNRTEYFIVRLS